MRYTCDEPGLEGSWIEYTDSWSRAESRDVWAMDGEMLLALLRTKLTTLHLLCADGGYLDNADDLTEAKLDAVDMRVYVWFSATWVRCLNDLTNQGNASRRRLFATSAAGETQTTTNSATAPSGHPVPA